jgi:probable rRNA maturation factor
LEPDSSPFALELLQVDIAFNDSRWENYLHPQRFQTETFELLKYIIRQVAPWLSNSEVSIVLSNDTEIHQLNKTYRHQDKPTNVLSFGNFEQPIQPEDIDFSYPLLLGDIVLSLDTLLRETEEQSKSFSHHLSHMLVHSFLHLLGYDHMTDEEAEQMEALEIDILSKHAIANPYEIK